MVPSNEDEEDDINALQPPIDDVTWCEPKRRTITRITQYATRNDLVADINEMERFGWEVEFEETNAETDNEQWKQNQWTAISTRDVCNCRNCQLQAKRKKRSSGNTAKSKSKKDN